MSGGTGVDGADRLATWMREHGVTGRLLRFSYSCHSVAEAASAAGVEATDIVKNIALIGADDELIVAILPGPERVSSKRVGKALGIAVPRLASPSEILERSGFPAGGTPSFGFEATFVVDPTVMERDHIYTGGGSSQALVVITPAELVRVNSASVARVRK